MRGTWFRFGLLSLLLLFGMIPYSSHAQSCGFWPVAVDTNLNPIGNASGVLTGDCSKQTGSRLGEGGEIGAYYYKMGSDEYIERGVMTYNTTFLDSNAVIDSAFIQYYTTSVSDSNASFFFMRMDTMLNEPPDWSNSWGYGSFDSTAVEMPDSNLEENSGPYWTKLDSNIVSAGGYTVIGMRTKKDVFHCNTEGTEFVYLNTTEGKELRLVIYYHTPYVCCVVARVYPQKAYDEGCRVYPEQATGECCSEVTFRAEAANGWKFRDWSGAASGTRDSIRVTLTQGPLNCDSLRANFVPAGLPVSLVSAEAAYTADGVIRLKWEVAS